MPEPRTPREAWSQVIYSPEVVRGLTRWGYARYMIWRAVTFSVLFGLALGVVAGVHHEPLAGALHGYRWSYNWSAFKIAAIGWSVFWAIVVLAGTAKNDAIDK